VALRRGRNRHIDATTAAVRQDAPALPLGAVIRVLNSAAVPARFRLSLGSCILGAGAESHIRVPEATVSRRHAELSIVPEGVMVEDLGSRNGTFYLGQRVERIMLALGSRIRVGTVEVAIDADMDALTRDLAGGAPSYGDLVGTSPAMRELFAVMKRLEGSLASVLLQGESGVGKELAARAIHAGSLRASAPFVVVNCGGIARELVLSELFGHKKGAFTGAIENRIGAFETADGGSVFLDEIGELPLDVQPVLLRVLESGEVQRVGETTQKRVSVRIIAATNRDLAEDVREKRFRSDLYYRLAVVKLLIPPLRERPEDVELLATTFARNAGLTELPREALEQFRLHDFPGNVRELRNAVEAYVALGTLPGTEAPLSGALTQALRQMIDPERPYAEQKERFAEHFTRIYLTELLTRTNGNQSEAARISGLERSYLGKLVQKLGITDRSRSTRGNRPGNS